MDDFSLPVIGEGDAQPNDTFIEQIVNGAKAAVEYVTKRGVCDPKKCAVGGHSYGSFMTAHMLSHTSLFAAGIGRSGAFNRTLTPMSFQSEDRSIWEAPDIYITMSPLMHVKKYSEQEKVGKFCQFLGGHRDSPEFDRHITKERLGSKFLDWPYFEQWACRLALQHAAHRGDFGGQGRGGARRMSKAHRVHAAPAPLGSSRSHLCAQPFESVSQSGDEFPMQIDVWREPSRIFPE